MPLCTQITLTPVVVTATGITGGNTAGVYDLDTASTAFTAVQSGVTAAQSSADGKNTITYSGSSPSGSGTRVGDIWWKYSGGLAIGYWVWNGSSWASQQLDGVTVTNLNAASITTGILSSIEIQSGAGSPKPFSVSAAGAVTATSGTVGGFTLSSTALTSAANSSFYVGNAGSWQCQSINALASATSAVYIPNGGITIGASYSWTNDGNLTASNVNCNTINSNAAALTLQCGSLYGTSSIYTSTPITGRTLLIGPSTAYQIGTSSSTRRVKQDIMPTTFDPSPLLGLPLQQFRYIRDVETQGDAAEVQTGLMAEDVADAGLEWLIDRDDAGLPAYIYWSERMPQALLQLVQQQAATISALTARVTALEGL